MLVHPITVLYYFLQYTLKRLGDPDYQQRVWINHEGPEVGDYDETSGRFMQKCEEIFKHPDSFEGIDDTVLESLKLLYDKLDEFDNQIVSKFPEGKDQDFLLSPNWREIQKQAAETYSKILKHLKDCNYDFS